MKVNFRAQQPQIPTQPKQNDQNVRVKSLYANDLHSHVDGFAKLTTEVNKFRAENDKQGRTGFVFLGGDSYVGGNEPKNKLIVKIMNIIKPDAVVNGNHEFDSKGSTGLFDRMKDANYLTLGLNLNIKPGSPFEKLINMGKLAKSTVIEKNGEKFGVIGLTPSDLFMRISQETKDHCNDFSIMNLPDTIKAVQQEVNQLEKQGVNKISLVSHMGYDADVAMAKAVDGLDVIHGAHSHDTLPGLIPKVNIFTSRRGEPVIITQAGKNGHAYGVLDVEYDKNGKIVSAKNDIRSLENVPQSLMVNVAQNIFLGKPQVIGEIAETVKALPEYALQENPLCSFLCDAYKKYTGADIVYNNGGTMRASLYKGPITDAQIMDLMPYFNEVSVYKFSEKEIIDTLNNAIEATAKYHRTGALQVAGLQYTIGTDHKVKDVYFVKDDGTKEKIDAKAPRTDKFYTVAYNSFLFGGSEGLANLHAPEKKVAQADKNETEMLIEYIKSFNGKPVKIAKTGRIINENRQELIPENSGSAQAA